MSVYLELRKAKGRKREENTSRNDEEYTRKLAVIVTMCRLLLWVNMSWKYFRATEFIYYYYILFFSSDSSDGKLHMIWGLWKWFQYLGWSMMRTVCTYTMCASLCHVCVCLYFFFCCCRCSFPFADVFILFSSFCLALFFLFVIVELLLWMLHTQT